ncbi:molybdopterin-dependent oxidoreductase [Schnuerera sp.]|uniref:molybdopterin-dependent oxidoreductase n=1 Tax=Schnuerera sp. TaxID=2794844 RepID=UPI002BBAF773|nr:molybdopterin-dependent oxidoreductase [Schnuerera sp.]HSH34827.1 molybdopterin-dependent oxidoreductase [Schnuerera sp.]
MSNRTIGIILFILIIIMGVFGLINRQMVKDNKEAHENAEIIIKEEEKESKLKFEDIVDLGEEEFTAVLDTSDSNPKEHNYTGVPLSNIIEEVKINMEDKKQVIIKGIDGYTVALSIKEVMDENNVYLAYKFNGKFLKSKEKGGSGPYQIIVRKDQFSQRWCKFVVELEVK